MREDLIERLRTPLSVSMFASKDHMINALLSERGEAAAALEAAREDAERLDWMDIHRGDDVRQDPHSGGPVLVAHYWAIEGQCTDIRAAIDQARGKGVAGR